MQDTVAILIAIAAGAFLARRGWLHLMRRKAGACGACSNCPSNSTATPANLVTISPIASHAKAQCREEEPEVIPDDADVRRLIQISYSSALICDICGQNFFPCPLRLAPLRENQTYVHRDGSQTQTAAFSRRIYVGPKAIAAATSSRLVRKKRPRPSLA